MAGLGNWPVDPRMIPPLGAVTPPFGMPTARAHGKGSVQEIAPPQTGQHNLLHRFLSLFGRDPNAPPAQPATALSQWWSGSATPQDVAAEFAAAAPPVLFGNVRIPNPIRAYHGSPHAFDEFRMDRIGTGEGAQSYGHGLYFAEAEPVAQHYRSNRYSLTDPNIQAFHYLEAANGDRGRALSLIAADIQRYSHDPVYAQQLGRTSEFLQSGATPSVGHMYEVNIHARPEQFLDWDRPLSGQSPEVDRALRTILKDRDRYPISWVTTSPGAEGRMSEAGIPGVRYLDQGSRAAGQGTHNYVIFNPEIIEILRRYGLLGPVFGVGAAAAAGNRNPNE